MSVGDDEVEVQLTQVTTTVGLPDTAAAAGAATEEEVYLPPPDAAEEDPDQALPTEVTEDLVSTVALGAVEDVPEPEPADDAPVTDNLDASVSDVAKTWRAKRDPNDGSQAAVAMPSADCLSAEFLAHMEQFPSTKRITQHLSTGGQRYVGLVVVRAKVKRAGWRTSGVRLRARRQGNTSSPTLATQKVTGDRYPWAYIPEVTWSST